MSNLRRVNPPTNLRLTAQNNQQLLQVEDGIIITGHNQDLVSLLPKQELTADTSLGQLLTDFGAIRMGQSEDNQGQEDVTPDGLFGFLGELSQTPTLLEFAESTVFNQRAQVVGVENGQGLVNGCWPGFDSGIPLAEGSFFNQWAQSWLVIPADFKLAGNIAIGLASLSLGLSLWLKKSWRWVLLNPAIYLAVFAWETRLAGEPAVSRLLVVGLTLMVLMIIRPQGMLGKFQVRVV